LLGGLVRKHGLQGSRCVLCLHPTQYEIAIVDRPEVEAYELIDALRWRIREVTDLPPTEAVIDVIEPAEGSAEQEAGMIGVVAAHRPVVEELHGQLTGAGLVPVAFDIIELCQRNLSELLPESAQGLLVIQLRNSITQIYGFREGELLLTRRTAVLGSQVAEELAQLAEGNALDVNTLENLTVEIQRTVDFYASRARRGQPTGLLLAPFEEELPGLCDHLTQMVDIVARPIDLNALCDVPHPLPDALQAHAIDAVGAALRAPTGVPS
ncbi:MAG: hypothetical protein R3298_11795, partial [Gammaproteobacteria bacterium]|nr:hypothetical protein [Gammaproteobacteria bacterium]